MGFALKGFMMGAATAVSEKMDADEKTAKEAAKLSASNLFRTYEENKKKTEEQVNQYTNNIATLKTNFKGLTEDQLYAGATNKAFMDGVNAAIKDRDIDLSTIDTSKLIKIADTASTGKTAEEQVRKLFDQTNVSPAPVPEGLGFFRNRAQLIQNQEFERTAKALGVEPGALRGSALARMPVQPSVSAEFNMEDLNKRKTLDQQKEIVATAIVKAKADGNDEALTKALEDASRIRMAEDMAGLSKKTEPQIQSELITKIQNAKDPKEKALFTAELRQRQVLSRLPGEGQEKITQSNLITVASKAVTSAVSDALPPGSFVITQNQDGTTTLAPKDIVSAAKFKEAMDAGRKAVIKEMTTPDGKPKDQMNRNALISVGVTFDDQGRAVVPSATKPSPTPAPAAPAASTPAAKPATTAQPTAAKPLPYTPEGAPDKGKLVKGQAYDDGNGNVKTWNGTGWK